VRFLLELKGVQDIRTAVTRDQVENGRFVFEIEAHYRSP
jgi:hypothetical protein